ncbi:DUF1080 domain-containing protein [Georgenia satyanarayanai]|uniref:3-keto-disaccharide hydrolase n=1 Tax=Georgenia satyanarayanai TaxID=860221 RepID=UPI00203EF997|nr:DUF1080 domain-containing protein [Georgenia satyanarayanai]MCM3661084.1 DUF1080 domain-containing protein [Georgenia satyanarayanai]
MPRKPCSVTAALAGVALVTMGCHGERPRPQPAATSVAPTGDPACVPVEGEEGYRSLFDGTRASLDTWRMAGAGRFELQAGCAMVTVGGMGLLWFPQTFEDYHLRLDWAMQADDNSGVFIAFPDPGHDPWVAVSHGYEVQIDPSDQPERTTGAVYGVQGADVTKRDEALEPVGEWNTYEIVTDGPRIAVYLNGVLVNDVLGGRAARGRIGLQNHGAPDRVSFRNIRISEH